MTVNNEVAEVLAAGTGSATIFSFDPMIVASSSEVKVWFIASNGTESLLSEGTTSSNYSVSVSSYPGTGHVTYPASGGTPIAVGEQLRIQRDTDITQEDDFDTQGGMFYEVIEGAFDKGRRIDAELRRDVDKNTDALDGLPAIIQETAVDADNVNFDNTASGLTATDVQAAIDELDTALDGLPSVYVPQSREITTSGPISGGGDLSGTVDVGMDTIAGVAGNWTNSDITADEYGRILAISNGTGGSGLTGVVNVKDYGATGDGSTDDTTAFTNAIAALSSTNNTLLIPPGRYKLTSQLSISNGDISIWGAGASATKLYWSTSSGGISVDVTRTGSYLLDYGYRFNVRGITFETDQSSSAGTALAITGSHSVGKVDVANTLQDLTFVGVSDTSAWDIGIDLVEVGQVSLASLKIDGRTASGEGTSKGVRIYGRDNSNNFFFDKCMMTWCDRGISIETASGGQDFPPEGVQVVNCNFVAVNYGIHGEGLTGFAGAGSEGLMVIGCHFAAEKNCITGYFVQSIFTENLFYDRPGSTTSDAMIKLPASSSYSGLTQILISDNEFITANGTGMQGVLVGNSGGSGDYSRVIVRGNYFQVANGSTAIIFHSNTSRCFTSHNVVVNGSSIADSGSRNSIGNRTHLGYLASDQAVTNSTNHAVVWDAEGADPEGLITVSSSDITIPSNSGIQRIIIKACVTFQGTASGYRSVVIEQDTGGGYTGNWVGAAGAGTDASATGNAIRLNVVTPTINVAGGYKYRVVASQTSGSTINLEDTRTWVEVEVVE